VQVECIRFTSKVPERLMLEHGGGRLREGIGKLLRGRRRGATKKMRKGRNSYPRSKVSTWARTGTPGANTVDDWGALQRNSRSDDMAGLKKYAINPEPFSEGEGTGAALIPMEGPAQDIS